MTDISTLPVHASADERAICFKLIEHLVTNLGFYVSVFEGEDWAIEFSDDPHEILSEMASTDFDRVEVYRIKENRPVGSSVRDDYIFRGSFFLIFGNGRDLISDHSDNEFCNQVADFVNLSVNGAL